MGVLSSLSPEQRQIIDSEGSPLAIMDDRTGLAYLLFSVQMSELSDGSIAAAIPNLGLYAEGHAPDEAVATLATVAKML